MYTCYSASSWKTTSEPLRYGTCSQWISQFYRHTHTFNLQSVWAIPAFCLPSYSWCSFTDPGGMEGWVGLGGCCCCCLRRRTAAATTAHYYYYHYYKYCYPQFSRFPWRSPKEHPGLQTRKFLQAEPTVKHWRDKEQSDNIRRNTIDKISQETPTESEAV